MLDENLITIFKEVSNQLTRSNKREFAAKITNAYMGGSARKAERKLGWSRNMISLGQKELTSQITCMSVKTSPSRPKLEETHKELSSDIALLLKNELQTDPKFQTDKQYCKMTAKAVCEQLCLIDKYTGVKFRERTMSRVLNRLGYTLKKR